MVRGAHGVIIPLFVPTIVYRHLFKLIHKFLFIKLREESLSRFNICIGITNGVWRTCLCGLRRIPLCHMKDCFWSMVSCLDVL